MASSETRPQGGARVAGVIFAVVLVPLTVFRATGITLDGLPVSLIWIVLCIPLVSVFLFVDMKRSCDGDAS